MKNYRLLLSCLCASLFFLSSAQQTQAQLPSPDMVPTKKGNLSIQPVFHAAMVLTWDNKTIYIDPYNGIKAYKGLAAPDLVLITDIHGDHLDTATLNAINTSNAKLIVPQAVADKLPLDYEDRVIVLNNGKATTEHGIEITAIPMYNLPDDSTSRHTKGRGNGYVLELGGRRIYISGDTEDIPEMRSLENIDIAFVCMNEPYTMTIEQAASAVVEFKPQIVYPYHYRGMKGLSDTEKFKKLVKAKNSAIDVRLKDWYTKAK